MKHLFLLGIILSSALTLTACKKNAEQKNTQAMDAPALRAMSHENMDMASSDMAAPEAGTVAMLFSRYQHLIHALSSDDSKASVAAAQAIVNELPSVKTNGMNASQKKAYEHIARDIKTEANLIIKNAGNLVKQRQRLEPLSTHFYTLAKTIPSPQPLYKLFCPMANEMKGGFWISNSKEIKNPYLGSAMLSCGEVQEEIK